MGETMKIEILGPGCANCRALAESARSVAEGLGLEFELIKVTDYGEIASRGVMATPALVVNGEVKLSGRVPTADELAELLKIS